MQMTDTLAILLIILFALAMSGGMVLLSALLGPRHKTKRKISPYECGMKPTGDARHHFSISFYMVAMIFILFDIEVIFMYPWAVVFLDMSPKLFAFIEMALFIAILLAGYLYAWKKGALEWD
jgi:NADH-quinone oxidoreductase subunit A